MTKRNPKPAAQPGPWSYTITPHEVVGHVVFRASLQRRRPDWIEEGNHFEIQLGDYAERYSLKAAKRAGEKMLRKRLKLETKMALAQARLETLVRRG